MNATEASTTKVELERKLTAAVDEMTKLHEAAGDAPLAAGAQERWNRLDVQSKRLRAEIAECDEVIRAGIAEHYRANPTHAEFPMGHGPELWKRGPADPWNANGNTRDLARYAAEKVPASDEARAALLDYVENDSTSAVPNLGAAWTLRTSDPDYAGAFRKLLKDPQNGHRLFTSDELRAYQHAEELRGLVVGTNTAGGFLVPSFLDPTIILTNSGAGSDVMRKIASVRKLTSGNVWTGVTSAGVDASWDAELAVVSDDSPTLAQISIPVFKGAGFIRASFEALEDTNIDEQVANLFADAKDRLESAAFMTGNGTSAAEGVFTRLAATTNSRYTSQTAATIGLVDLQGVYRSLGRRWRNRAVWLMNPLHRMTVQALGTAVSASFTSDLASPPVDYLFGKAVYDSDDAPATATTTALDPEIAFFDPTEYFIVDKVGATVEYVPHLFDTSTGRPTGERGFLLHWRVGGELTTASAGQLLVDKTSA